ncbi:metallophosphoesterase family protein [Devosia neptuniae]|jgi:calcineurin-like phosphoesterase family protein|uniref:metallophosphoesterase family protein n=1 Tax=Devosia TaxID=46913 RepID=UPI0022AE6706|nr:metallophosphoesterase family protein [Devosia neptuniae]MCZ4344605.1 metallophosphoesterase family protein [Devosia neptuniae]|tara:strand:- start:9774 stop:10292 length:519 start_codon:yes stop_codon:yes gene_type:complete
MLYFTSDTHFADPRVLRLDRRPFANMAEHDAALIASWNSVVQADDDIWHLGDVVRGDQGAVEALLHRLNGTKHLIVGNNDPLSTQSAQGWASVQHYAELKIDNQLYVLCHYPFRTWNQMGKKSINLHGHSHGRLALMPRQFDVGVDPQGLRPRRLDEIVVSRRRGRTATPAA